jgi:hypothetical protein
MDRPYLQAFHLGVQGQAWASLVYSWGYHFGQGATNMGQTQNGQLLAFSHPAALPHHVRIPASPTYIGRSLPLQYHLLFFSLSRLSAPSTSSSLTASCFAASSNMSVGLMPWSVAKSDERSPVRLVHISFDNCDLLSAGVSLLKWHLERGRERDAKSLSERVQSTLGQLLVVMRLCCFDSSMELPLSCRSEDRSCYVLQVLL